MDKSMLDTSWIWHPEWVDHAEDSAGGFVHFRKTITIDALPETPVNIQITADTRYKLYINSQFIFTGPVKGDEHSWFYDVLNIQPHLKLGENHICIRVLRFFYATPYATTFPRLPIPGLYIRMADKIPTLGFDLSSDASWETAIDLSTRLRIDEMEDDFLHTYEDVDMALENGLKWVTAKALRLPKSHGLAPPWVLLPRLIPNHLYTDVRFKAVRYLRSPESKEKWENVLLKPSNVESTPGIVLAPGTSHHIELEAEHHITALVKFLFQRPQQAGSKLTVTYSEGYEDPPASVPYFRKKGDRCDSSKMLLGPQDKYIFGGNGGKESSADLGYNEAGLGKEIFAPFHFRTLRFITLDITVSEQAELVMAGIGLTTTNYPLETLGNFSIPPSSTSDTYQTLWDISIRTLNNCMHDCYEDCPFYEQLQYAMDVRSSCLFTYCVSGDDRLARQAIMQLHSSYRPDTGLTASRAPSHQRQVIPHFSLYWICMVADHHEYFGDAAFARQFLPACDGILEHFSRRIDPKLGLVACHSKTHWDFVDWTEAWRPMGIPPAAERTGFQTYTNLLYSYALQRTAHLVAAVGRPGLVSEYNSRADGIIKAVKSHCFANGFFTDGLASVAELDKDFSQHNQIWAVLCGAVTQGQARDILSQSLRVAGSLADTASVMEPSRASDIVELPSFTPVSEAMAFYALRALSVAGGELYNDSFHAFWEPWKVQVSQNLSTWQEDTISQRSDCHAWGCAPLHEFMVEVAGVRPELPGWAAVAFAPRTSLFPDFEAKVPLGGKLADVVADVSWHRVADITKISLSLRNTSPHLEFDTRVPVFVKYPGGRTEELAGPDIHVQF